MSSRKERDIRQKLRRRRKLETESNDVISLGDVIEEPTNHKTKRNTSETSKSTEKLRKQSKKKSFYSRKSFLIIAITVIGLFITHIVSNNNATLELAEASQEWLLTHKEMLPTSLVDLLQQFQQSDRERDLSNDFAVGMHMYNEGYRPKHPVIMIPGVISSALVNWGLHGSEECPSKAHYRKQMWGGFYMLKSIVLSKNCWLRHLMLDKETGLDPPDFKVRAAQGIESADYFITGYWIWNKIIENLSALGYDQNYMNLASYDWRLGYPDLERRDGYFSHLKALCEVNLRLTGYKTSLVGHSMGSQVIFYFLKWVEAMGPGYGNGGPSWVNDHVAHFVDISGSMLGTPKALVALLSGEMRDTITLNQLAVAGLEKFFSRDERADLIRSWPGIASMLPKGGNAIWGHSQAAPDDPMNKTETFGNFIRFTDKISSLSEHNLTLENSFNLLHQESPSWFSSRVKSMYSYGLSKTRAEVVSNEKDPSKWSNPLEVSLPNASDLEIYSLYGVGKDTERAYYYRDSTNDTTTPLNAVIDYESMERGSVVTGPGDGTISLPSHAISHRWKDKNSKFNPGGSKVKIVEMLHKPDVFDLRGGTQTADHVDVLGRTELNELVLKIVSGNGAEIEEVVHSNIEDWVWDLDLGSN